MSLSAYDCRSPPDDGTDTSTFASDATAERPSCATIAALTPPKVARDDGGLLPKSMTPISGSTVSADLHWAFTVLTVSRRR